MEHEQAQPGPTLLRKTAWSASASLFAVLGRFVAGVITARMLGLGGVGQLAYLLWIADIVLTVASLGLGQSLTRFLADLAGRGSRGQIAPFARWVFLRYVALVFLAACVLTAFLLTHTDSEISRAAWGVLVAYFVMQGLGLLYSAHLAGLQRFDLSARVNLGSAVLLLIGVSVGTAVFGLAGAMAGYLLGTSLPGLLSLSMPGGKAGSESLDQGLQKEVARYAAFAWFASIVTALVWTRAEIFFIRRYMGPDGPEAVAMFTMGLNLANYATQGPMMFTSALMPHFAERAGARDLEQVRSIYRAGTGMLSLVLFPVCFMGAAVMPVVLPAVYGEGFAPAVPAAAVLVGFSASMSTVIGSQVLWGTGYAWFNALGNSVCSVLSVTLCMVLIPRIGLPGALWARVIVQSIGIGAGIWFLNSRLRCPTPLWNMAVIAVCALAGAAAIHLILMRWSTLYAPAVAVPAGFAIYVCLVRIVKVVDEGDAAMLENAMSRIPIGAARRLSPVVQWMIGGRSSRQVELESES